MEALDWSLVVAGPVLAAGSIVFLLVARSRRARAAAALAALAVALTLVHPFGMKAEAVTRVPAGAVKRDPSDVNTARIAGLPAMGFKLFRRDKPRLLNDYDTEPSATLQARSWVWPFLFTSSSELAQMCEVGARAPCWKPEKAGSVEPPTPSPYARTLSLWSKDGESWVKVENPHVDPVDPLSLQKQWVFHVRPAVTSWWGLGYWLLAAGIVLVRVRARGRDGVATT